MSKKIGRKSEFITLFALVMLALTAAMVLVTELAYGEAVMEPRGALLRPELAVETLVETEPSGAVATVLHLEEYIKKFLSTWYKPGTGKRWAEVPEMARWIYDEATAAQIDPYMLAITVKFESGFMQVAGLGVEGKRGERGLGQLHGLARNRAIKAGCDLETPQGQLRGAALWLRTALDSCGGDELQAFRAYQTGDCRVKTTGSTLRFAELLRLRKAARAVSIAQGEDHDAHL